MKTISNLNQKEINAISGGALVSFVSEFANQGVTAALYGVAANAVFNFLSMDKISTYKTQTSKTILTSAGNIVSFVAGFWFGGAAYKGNKARNNLQDQTAEDS